METVVAIGAMAAGLGIGVVTFLVSIAIFGGFVAGVIVAGIVAAAIEA